MTETPPLAAAWPIINSTDWNEHDFALDKAYVCALMSEFAYLNIPEFEVRETGGRIKAVPSEAYQRLIRTLEQESTGEAFTEGELRLFMIARRYAVVVGVQAPQVLFLAIRGTKFLYDWLINLNATKYRLRNSRGAAFHRGFLKAIQACIDPLARELKDRTHRDQPIYVTGHSLGGAMAAMLHTDELESSRTHGRWRTHSGYTQGMPRWGNFAAVSTLRNPYHLYNEVDIVPTVPPTWAGYASGFNEYRLKDGQPLELAYGRSRLSFLRWNARLAFGSGIKEHSVELYRRRLEKLRSK